jgi:hypothetical protein
MLKEEGGRSLMAAKIGWRKAGEMKASKMTKMINRRKASARRKLARSSRRRVRILRRAYGGISENNGWRQLKWHQWRK